MQNHKEVISKAFEIKNNKSQKDAWRSSPQKLNKAQSFKNINKLLEEYKPKADKMSIKVMRQIEPK